MQHNPKNKKRASSLHWAARFAIKYGTLCSLLLLVSGFCFPKASFYAISICKSAVTSFAVSVIGGLFIDVIAFRRGMDE